MKYLVRCIGSNTYRTIEGKLHWAHRDPCGWTGVRTAYRVDCECYDLYALYCRPLTPGPGCPSGINWPCPRCGGSVTGQPVRHRVRSED